MAPPFTSAAIAADAPDRFHWLHRTLGVTSFGISQIVLEPGQRGRIHLHEQQEEVFLVLAGRLTVAFDGEEHDFAEGELVRIAPEVRRQMINRGPARLSLLALGGAGEHEHRDARAFASWDAEPQAPRDVPTPPDLPADELRGA